MIYLLNCLALLSHLLVVAPAHDVAMAIFEISSAEEGLEVAIEFDQEDYAKANDLKVNEIDRYRLQEYLDCSTSWTINGTQQKLLLSGFEFKEGHLQATGTIPTGNSPLKSLEIINEFLLSIQDQTNVVLLKIDGATRGFRMHTGRKKIIVGY